MLHIPSLAQNLISISIMSDAGIHTIFDKDSCKMVRREMVLMRGMRIGTLYKLMERTDSNSCYHMVVLETYEISSCLFDSTRLLHQWLGYIDKKGLRPMHIKCMVEGFPNCSLEFHFYEHCSMENRIM